jgi:hypothetical protein
VKSARRRGSKMLGDSMIETVYDVIFYEVVSCAGMTSERPKIISKITGLKEITIRKTLLF